jgi:hypothetical protein
VEDSFYEEVERVFDKFLKRHMKISLGDFNAKVGREDILNRQPENIDYKKFVMKLKLEE